ncbi:hypothetical protein CcrC1_gp446 [Caulobacter phage C1]|nr:hypothetical protein CcrC1_gp446 [Caulobacter phage C1]UTU09753.1 hypothetical protein CcrBL47_gp469 [Caulobacter phage BL47]UTU10307.1 hypothetical protein CcrRB23_gp445 [Caulobacter phage RB23]WGN97860.1 hypothetical protein [Bertelyvirus sp.]
MSIEDLEEDLAKRFDEGGYAVRKYAREQFGRMTLDMPALPDLPDTDEVDTAIAFANHFGWFETKLDVDAVIAAWSLVETFRQAPAGAMDALLARINDHMESLK